MDHMLAYGLASAGGHATLAKAIGLGVLLGNQSAVPNSPYTGAPLRVYFLLVSPSVDKISVISDKCMDLSGKFNSI